MRALGRPFRLLVVITVTLLSLGVGGGYLYLRRSLPPSGGRLTIEGLAAPVEVIRDRWGVAHVYAQHEADLFAAQGYVQAQDRLWQMELYRRAARGTLSEVIGPQALSSDRLARTLGFGRQADEEWQALDAGTRQVLEAYARGVNAFLSASGRRLPPEFTLLGYRPDPWQGADSLACGRLLAWSMEGGWQQELLRARLVRAVGPQRAGELLPGEEMALPGELSDLSVLAQPLLLEGEVQWWPWFSGTGLGGSAWAVTGPASATGGPILACAPVLAVQTPSPWYQVHLCGAGYDVAGAALPGLPGVALGRNPALAWGLTGTAADTVDLYVERLHPGEPPQAEFRGAWQDLGLREEEIRVRGRVDPVRIWVYATRHGPLVTAVEGSTSEAVAVQWAGAAQPAALARNVLALNRARGLEEFRAALEGWAAPGLLFVVADATTQAAHALAPAAPERTVGGGRFPTPGWTGRHEWLGSAPGPRELGADSGLLVAADGVSGAEGRRPAAARIRALVATHNPVTLADARAIQCDERGPDQELLRHLLALEPGGWIQQRTTPYLRRWDLGFAAESAGAGVFAAFCWRLAHNTLDDELGPELVDRYLSLVADHRSVLERWSREPDNPWFDDGRTPAHERRDDLLAQSYAEGIDWLGRRFGDLPYEWNWGRVHNVTFRHALGERWPYTVLLNRGAMRVGGSPECANATGSDYGRGMAVGAAPTYRLIVALGPGGEAVAVNAPGQSGNPLSRHYADMIELWRQGSYHPLLWEPDEIGREKEALLTLVPGE